MVAAPRFISRVDDARGIAIYDAPERHTQAISPTTAFLMSSMLADVITSGTATGARAAGFKLPAAGKTGTTDNYTDAWFAGYQPNLATVVWVGYPESNDISMSSVHGQIVFGGTFQRASSLLQEDVVEARLVEAEVGNAHVLTVEERVVRAFGSDEEIARLEQAKEAAA